MAIYRVNTTLWARKVWLLERTFYWMKELTLNLKDLIGAHFQVFLTTIKLFPPKLVLKEL